jgi:hypothetical protein
METGFAAVTLFLILAALLHRRSRPSGPLENPRTLLREELDRLELAGRLRLGRPGWGRIREVITDDARLRQAADDALLADRMLEVEQQPGNETGFAPAWSEQLRKALEVLRRA